MNKRVIVFIVSLIVMSSCRNELFFTDAIHGKELNQFPSSFKGKYSANFDKKNKLSMLIDVMDEQFCLVSYYEKSHKDSVKIVKVFKEGIVLEEKKGENFFMNSSHFAYENDSVIKKHPLYFIDVKNRNYIYYENGVLEQSEQFYLKQVHDDWFFNFKKDSVWDVLRLRKRKQNFELTYTDAPFKKENKTTVINNLSNEEIVNVLDDDKVTKTLLLTPKEINDKDTVSSFLSSNLYLGIITVLLFIILTLYLKLKKK